LDKPERRVRRPARAARAAADAVQPFPAPESAALPGLRWTAGRRTRDASAVHGEMARDAAALRDVRRYVNSPLPTDMQRSTTSVCRLAATRGGQSALL
jgi:hypothetical protein